MHPDAAFLQDLHYFELVVRVFILVHLVSQTVLAALQIALDLVLAALTLNTETFLLVHVLLNVNTDVRDIQLDSDVVVRLRVLVRIVGVADITGDE